ncbi:MAG TPA: M20/M25/M40 family metallo-hydrolase [Acidimicrobiales bacterium]|nr:M20/M25/M40 family metallo-hydrolase [Acidimicrobiales bacterium]
MDPTGEVTELLQLLIRNACVNDGTAASGHEARNSDLLRAYLGDTGLDLETYEPTPGRTSLVARIEGHDPSAPTLCLMGHTDVVPVTPEGWRRDPFGGELVAGDDGTPEVWGRGAIDMLNLTASMAVAFRHLAVTGWKPAGTLVYFAVADEEAGGRHGAEWVTEHEYEAVRADYVLTESGGISMPSAGGPRVTVTTGEKGIAWRRLRIEGTPGHGSMPFGTDNALVKAAEVVRRLVDFRSPAKITDTWRAYASALDLPADVRAGLLDPARVWETCAALAVDDPKLAKFAHACTHMTFSPNVVHGGVKTNVIPDVVEIDVDIRTLPGEDEVDVAANLREALGDLADAVVITTIQSARSTASPTSTPLWDVIGRSVAKLTPGGAGLVPRMTAGGTDARFYRDKGAVAYGCGLFSPGLTMQDFANRFHGHDERVDVESLRLTTELWTAVATDLLG